MGNQNKKSESVNQTMAIEPSHETVTEMESQSNLTESEKSSASSEVGDSFFLIKYSPKFYDSQSQSSSPVSISMSVRTNDEVQVDTNVFRPIEPMPSISTNNDVKKVPTVRKITAKIKSEQSESGAEKSTVNQTKPTSTHGTAHSDKQDSNTKYKVKRYSHRSLSDESQSKRHLFKNPLYDKYMNEHTDASHSSIDIDKPKGTKNSNSFGHFEPSDHTVDIVESQADESIISPSPRSVSSIVKPIKQPLIFIDKKRRVMQSEARRTANNGTEKQSTAHSTNSFMNLNSYAYKNKKSMPNKPSHETIEKLKHTKGRISSIDIGKPKKNDDEHINEHSEASSDIIFIEPTLETVYEVESSHKSSSRSASPTSMANEKTIGQRKLNSNTIEVNKSKEIETSRDSIAEEKIVPFSAEFPPTPFSVNIEKLVESMSQEIQNPIEMKMPISSEIQPKIEDEMQFDLNASETKESIENESDVKNIENRRNFYSNDEESDSDGIQWDSNARPSQNHIHLKHRPNRISSQESQWKRQHTTRPTNDPHQCCSYQKNYIHLKGETIYLEIGLPKDCQGEHYTDEPVTKKRRLLNP